MASKKKPKAEAGSKRGNEPEEAVGPDLAGKKAKAVKAASKKAASKKAASKKTANKKVAGKKTANKKHAASKAGASTTVTAKQRIKKAPAADALERDPFEVAKQTMKGSVPAIVEAMVAQAKKGSCSHAKTVLEMTGAKHMFGDEAEMADSGEPWAKLVLERMDEAEQESLSQELPKVAAEP